MKPKIAILLVAFTIATPFVSVSEEPGEDELFELSPFSLDGSDDQGYRATSTLAGTRIRTNLRDVGSAISILTDEFGRSLGNNGISVPVSLIKPADEARVEVAISFYDDLEIVRKQKLNEYMDKAQVEIESHDGLEFEAGEMKIAKGDLKRAKGKKRSEYTSHAFFNVVFGVNQEVSTKNRIREIKKIIDGLGLDSEFTRTYYGPTLLVLRNPNQYRTELMQAVLADTQLLEDGLGGKFEVCAIGMNGRVRSRQFSDTEVEVWLQYSIQYESTREREDSMARIHREHELAMEKAKQIGASKRCCCSNVCNKN